MIGVLICTSSYWNFIHYEFTKLNSKPLLKNIVFSMLIFTLIIVVFILIRNQCCDLFSFFVSHSSSFIDLTCFIFVSFCILFFIDIQLSQFFFDIIISIYEHFHFKSSTKIELLTILLLLMFSSIILFLFEFSSLIFIWSVSFLFVNLLVVSSTLLINYFPYQILNNNSIKESKSKVLFQTKEDLSLIKMPIVKSNNDIDEDDGLIIENAFLEYKFELKNQALNNKSLRFGSDQPSIKSAYRSIIGYLIFITCSIFSSVTLNYLKSLKPFEYKYIFISLSIFLIITSLQIFFVYLLVIRNSRETIYNNLLFFKSPFTPFSQLFISYLNIILIFQIKYNQILVFILILLILVFFIIIIQSISNRINISNQRILISNTILNESNIFIINKSTSNLVD